MARAKKDDVNIYYFIDRCVKRSKRYTRYFSYSSVEDLYYICTHRILHGVTQDFLDCYKEKVCFD